ncbi:hypothetical protein E2562_029580 [Oryza meyeriana var. granulata]|uniref:Uncharacterized protein n=1 Tax=Oryza meyeriana var. granulata TaxID=110450 RepID=A0A6G1C9L2_9ORYZ|nr:hypothetical protein E2562_029580 [Oryza meyeriana var. granulata]
MAERVPVVLWGHRTLTTRATGFTPSKLLFGNKTMTPMEIKGQSLRTVLPEHADERGVSIDLVKEIREGAAGNLSRYAAATKAWYDNKLLPRHFVLGDMVLRRALSPGKLQRKWEGPFIVTWAGTNGAYRLAELDGTSLPHSWNVEALRKYYVIIIAVGDMEIAEPALVGRTQHLVVEKIQLRSVIAAVPVENAAAVAGSGSETLSEINDDACGTPMK